VHGLLADRRIELHRPLDGARAVFTPPTTSTSGMTCGGLNGCPTRQRSGCAHFDCMTLGVMPDELDAMIESGGVASSMSANSFILNPAARAVS